jgi:hypothetical protein
MDEFYPHEDENGENCPPSGLAGAGTIHRSPSPFLATSPPPPLENYNVLAFQFGLIRNRPTKAQYIPCRVYKLRNPNLIHSSPSPPVPQPCGASRSPLRAVAAAAASHEPSFHCRISAVCCAPTSADHSVMLMHCSPFQPRRAAQQRSSSRF